MTNFFRFTVFVFFFSFIVLSASAQPKADSLIAAVLHESDQVRSFQADVSIDVDVDFIRIPVKKGRVFYKAPDKFRFRATGFVLVPKKGLDFSVQEMLRQQHTAIYLSSDDTNHLLKIVPMTDEADYVIATLWIDKQLPRINKMDITMRKKGNFVMTFTYGNLPFQLPVATQVDFDISQIDIPMKFLGNMKKEKSDKPKSGQGRVKMTYSDFKINGDIPEQVFTENEASDSVIVISE